MILNGILFVLKGILNVLLLPLTVVDIGIDFLASIPIVEQFIQVAAYIIPWKNILPVIVIVIGITVFRVTVAFIKTVWDLLPIF